MWQWRVDLRWQAAGLSGLWADDRLPTHPSRQWILTSTHRWIMGSSVAPSRRTRHFHRTCIIHRGVNAHRIQRRGTPRTRWPRVRFGRAMSDSSICTTWPGPWLLMTSCPVDAEVCGGYYVAGPPLLNGMCTSLLKGPRLRNDLYCVEWDVKLYYTIPYNR